MHVHECCGCAWFPSRHVHTPEANLSENTTEASHYGFSTLLLLFLFCFSSTKTCKTSSTSSPTVESLLSAPWCLVPAPASFYPQTVELILPVSWCLQLESMIIKKNHLENLQVHCCCYFFSEMFLQTLIILASLTVNVTVKDLC